MEPLAISSGVAGVIALGLNVSHGLLEYYRSWKHAEDKVASTYASVEALAKILTLLDSTVAHWKFDPKIVLSVEESIASAEAGIQSLREKTEQGTWRPVTRRMEALSPGAILESIVSV